MTRTRWVMLALLFAGSGVWGILLLDEHHPAYAAWWAIRGTAATWLVGGFVIWVVARVFRRKMAFWRALVSSRWLGLLLLGTALGFVTLATSDDTPELTATERAFVRYINASIGCYENADRLPALQEQAGLAVAARDFKGAETMVRRYRRVLTDLHVCLMELTDTGDPELDAAAVDLGDAIRGRVVAADFYVVSMRARDADVIDRGDEHDRRASARIEHAVERINAIGRRHRAVILDHIDRDRLERLEEPAPGDLS